jgi:hypothetical protein
MISTEDAEANTYDFFQDEWPAECDRVRVRVRVRARVRVRVKVRVRVRVRLSVGAE